MQVIYFSVFKIDFFIFKSTLYRCIGATCSPTQEWFISKVRNEMLIYKWARWFPAQPFVYLMGLWAFSWVGCVMGGGGGVNQSSFRNISRCAQVRKMSDNERNHPLTPLPACSGTTNPSSDPFIHTSVRRPRVRVSPRARTRGSRVWAGHGESRNDMAKEGKKEEKKKKKSLHVPSKRREKQSLKVRKIINIVLCDHSDMDASQRCVGLCVCLVAVSTSWSPPVGWAETGSSWSGEPWGGRHCWHTNIPSLSLPSPSRPAKHRGYHG